jgi:hypothetical protein
MENYHEVKILIFGKKSFSFRNFIISDEVNSFKQELDFTEDRFMSIKHQMEGTYG